MLMRNNHLNSVRPKSGYVRTEIYVSGSEFPRDDLLNRLKEGFAEEGFYETSYEGHIRRYTGMAHQQDDWACEASEKLLRILPTADGFVVHYRASDDMGLRRRERRLDAIAGQSPEPAAFQHEDERVPESHVWCYDDYFGRRHAPAPTDPNPV